MSHITYFPSEKSRWKKSMLQYIKSLPRAIYKKPIQVKNKSTGKITEKLVDATLSDREISRIVYGEKKSTKDEKK
jgi:hypothetical protein